MKCNQVSWLHFLRTGVRATEIHKGEAEKDNHLPRNPYDLGQRSEAVDKIVLESPAGTRRIKDVKVAREWRVLNANKDLGKHSTHARVETNE